MEYNKTKRRFSVISSIFGLILSIVAFAVSILGFLGFFKADKNSNLLFDFDGLAKKFLNMEFKFNNNKIILIVFAVVALFAFLLSISLLKKPMEIDEKYKNFGFKKLLYIIFILICGIAIASCNKVATFGIKEGADPDYKISLIVLIVSAVVALLQFISMFFRKVKAPKKEKAVKVKKAKKEKVKKEKKTKKEKAVVAVAKVEEAVTESAQQEDNQVNLQEALFKALANDPVADGFKQRIREIKHLKEVGLLDDEQVAFAVEKIIKNYMK